MMVEPTVNQTEAEERAYLGRVKHKISIELETVNERLSVRHAEMTNLKDYLQENKATMDHVEKASIRQSVDMMSSIGEEGVSKKERLAKLLESPYFGRIDILTPDEAAVRNTYIGIHSFYDAEIESHLIHDWRAPISSMFYEFELGEAHYDSPGGRVDCQVLRKRQYRIEKQELKLMLESSLNIQDGILQEELSRASDDKMRNIVATIQRDQNAIIRNDQTHTLIIQGAAGSGKTSIALHRIAFLLYKYKDTIRSEDILIVSPNKVFAHYISQVLPELGEEMIQETTMESLASELLEDKVSFQTFADQVSVLLVGRDTGYAERIKFKASSEFLKQLESYARSARNATVQATDLQVGMFTLEAVWIADRFRSVVRRSSNEQIAAVLNDIVEHLLNHHGKEIDGKERTRLRTELRRMIPKLTLASLYKKFYAWLEAPEMFKMVKGGRYEYSDVFPLIYLKLMIEGAAANHHIKHVVIDEMQDYTPVQYEVLARLYSCKKTILGDHNQSVNPLSSSSAEAIQEILPDSECVYMHKSYRSTIEITQFAQSIHCNANLIPIERHGDLPTLVSCDQPEQEVEHLRREIDAFLASDHNSLGIICKTQQQADWLYAKLADGREAIRLLDAQSTTFSQGVMIVTAYFAKGLEFDQVLVPFCNDMQYNSVIDRHMLYVACTRAMHQLGLTHTEEPSRLLQASLEQSTLSRKLGP